MRLALSLGLFLLTACGSTVVDLQALSRSCSVDADCEPVYVGDACVACFCSNAAIATSGQATYDAEFKAARSHCWPAQTAVCLADCRAPSAQCTRGQCTLK